MTCSRALVRGSRLKLWNTKPIFLLRTTARSSLDSFATSWPSSQYSPEVGRSRQPSVFMRVVLPEPEAPMRATISPRPISSDTPLSTGRSTWPSRYVLRMSTSLISSIGPTLSPVPRAARHPVPGRTRHGLLLPPVAAEHLRGEGVGRPLRAAGVVLADDDRRSRLQVALDDLGHGTV